MSTIEHILANDYASVPFSALTGLSVYMKNKAAGIKAFNNESVTPTHLGKRLCQVKRVRYECGHDMMQMSFCCCDFWLQKAS